MVAWVLSAAIYGLLGAVCAQLTLGWAIGTFLSVHTVLVAAVAFFGFIARYVTFCDAIQAGHPPTKTAFSANVEPT